MKTIKFTNGYCVNFEENGKTRKVISKKSKSHVRKLNSSLLFSKTTGLKSEK